MVSSRACSGVLVGPREVDEAADDTGEMSDAGEAGGGRVKNGGRVRASTWLEQEPTIAAIMAIANKTGTLCAGNAELPAHATLLRFAIRFLLTADSLLFSLAHAATGVHADRRASAEDGKAHADGAADDAGIVCRQRQDTDDCASKNIMSLRCSLEQDEVEERRILCR